MSGDLSKHAASNSPARKLVLLSLKLILCGDTFNVHDKFLNQVFFSGPHSTGGGMLKEHEEFELTCFLQRSSVKTEVTCRVWSGGFRFRVVKAAQQNLGSKD